MKRPTLILVASSLALSIFAPSIALADPPAARTSGARANDTNDGYTYTFKDDPLDAGGLTASDARIHVRPNGMRAVLTRPRTSFVAEMLRSVEKL